MEDGDNQYSNQQSTWMTTLKSPQINSHKHPAYQLYACITKLSLISFICHLVWKVITLTESVPGKEMLFL